MDTLRTSLLPGVLVAGLAGAVPSVPLRAADMAWGSPVTAARAALLRDGVLVAGLGVGETIVRAYS